MKLPLSIFASASARGVAGCLLTDDVRRGLLTDLPPRRDRTSRPSPGGLARSDPDALTRLNPGVTQRAGGDVERDVSDAHPGRHAVIHVRDVRGRLVRAGGGEAAATAHARRGRRSTLPRCARAPARPGVRACCSCTPWRRSSRRVDSVLRCRSRSRPPSPPTTPELRPRPRRARASPCCALRRLASEREHGRPELGVRLAAVFRDVDALHLVVVIHARKPPRHFWIR